MRKYIKPPISIENQINLFEDRGLQFIDKEFAKKVLQKINYYRLSGYCLPFEKSRHIFKQGASFEKVLALYEFDHQLRNLLDQALEVIEISIRTTAVHYLTNKYGAFAHEDKSIYFEFTDYEAWIDKVHQEAQRSKETFIQHYRKTYDGFPKIPFWVAVEIMSFGSLSQMISHLKKEDQINLSKTYELHHTVFISWLHTFTYVRNLCAHHSRIWNRSLSIEIRLPLHKNWEAINSKRMISVIMAIHYMLGYSKYKNSEDDQWIDKLSSLLERDLPEKELISQLGFKENWKDILPNIVLNKI